MPPLGVPEDRNATSANVTSGKIPGTFSHMPLLAPEHCRREARVADNRVFLPRAPGANIAGLEKANAHDPIHGKLYHATVAARLLGRRTDGAAAGRAELQSMRADMIAGIFPYRRA